MRILRAADYRRMPWKNGGGETVEIAAFPPSASVENFDWRISMATVATDGPFSVFEGVDRTLSILKGEGLELSVAGHEPVTLCQDTAPHAFPADVATSARLRQGAVTDLNVMTRRSLHTHHVRRLDVPSRIISRHASLLIFALGELTLAVGANVIHLLPFDCAYFPDSNDEDILVSGASDGLLIEIAQEQRLQEP